jgi:hypothetical protein
MAPGLLLYPLALFFGLPCILGPGASAGSPFSGAQSTVGLLAQNTTVAGEQQTDGADSNSGIQGWTGPVSSFLKPAPAARPATPPKVPAAADATKPQTDQTEGNPNFQGWDSDKNAYRNVTAEDMPSLRNNLRRSLGEEGEAHPGSRGFAPPLKMLHGPAGQ